MGNPFDLTGKVALVTGGGTGLGKGMALALAEAGADVVVASRDMGHLADAAAKIQALGRKGIALPLDVAQVPAIRAAVAEVVKVLGRLDILVNNAGTTRRGSALEFTEEDWDAVLDTNLKGLFFCAQAAARVMKEQGGGRIINVASLTSEVSFANIVAYAASKGGVRQLTKALALEWAPYRINVNAIGPGWFRTDLNDRLFQNPEWVAKITARIPQGRTGTPQDLGGATVFLASSASDYITGEILYVDGGFLAA